MSKNQPTRIELTNDVSDNQASSLGRGMTELESRFAPLVVIAIIAVLMGMLLPAIQK